LVNYFDIATSSEIVVLICLQPANPEISETPDSIRYLKPFLNWVHIANVITEPSHTQYGDFHPALSHPDGRVNPQILKDFYTALVDIDFAGGIGLEIMPYGEDLSESIMYNGIAYMKGAEAQLQVNYAIGGYRYKNRDFLPERLFFKISEFKLAHPEALREVALARKRRPYPWKENFIIVAADHPARNVTRVGSDEIAMGDRQQYLGRILRCLLNPEIDGIMATPDIFDDLFAVECLIKAAGGKSFLDDKILIGCTNRGGLEGSAFEMDDVVTAYTVKDVVDLNLDGVKMMFRLDLKTSQARYSQRTVAICADMIRECGTYNIPVFLEPLPVERVDNTYKVIRNHVDLIKTISVATALGGASSNKIWLKIPYVENFEAVARATSNPIVLLGGTSSGKPTDTIINFEKGLGAGPNIRGALVGRNLLYPGFDDPLAVSLAVAKIVKNYANAEESVKYLRTQRGIALDALTSLLLRE